MAESSTPNGGGKLAEPYGIEVNKAYGGIAVLQSSTPDTIQQQTNVTIMSAIIRQFPIFAPTVTTTGGAAGTFEHAVKLIVSKVEIWGPMGGALSMEVAELQPYYMNFVAGGNAAARRQFFDSGTVSARPYLTYTWPAAEEVPSGYDTRTAWDTAGGGPIAPTVTTANQREIFSFYFSGVGVAIEAVVYIHFAIKDPIVVAPPAMQLEILMAKDFTRAMKKYEHESRKKRKIERIKALTLPCQM